MSIIILSKINKSSKNMDKVLIVNLHSVVHSDILYHMVSMRHYIIVGNRKYEYVLEPARSRTQLVCEGAGISKRYSNSEIPAILAQLPSIIVALSQQDSGIQSEALRFRVTSAEKESIMQAAINAGYDNMSAYLRDKVIDT